MSPEERLIAPIVVALIIAGLMWAGVAAIDREERRARKRRDHLPKDRPLRRGYDD